jgi:hypothetical protein
VAAASTSQNAQMTRTDSTAEQSPAQGQAKGQEGQEGFDNDPDAGQPGQRRNDPDKALRMARAPEPGGNQTDRREKLPRTVPSASQRRPVSAGTRLSVSCFQVITGTSTIASVRIVGPLHPG